MSTPLTAVTICSRFPIGDEARALLREDQTPRRFLDELMAHGLRLDAMRLVAHTFPKRSAIWWGCLCVGEVLGDRPSESAARALEAARAWVIEPNDEHCRAAMPVAEAAGLETPAGCLAAAVRFSGESLAPPEMPPSPPPDHVTADLVFTALVSAGAVGQADRAPERYDRFLRLALELTEHKHLWPGADPARGRSGAQV